MMPDGSLAPRTQPGRPAGSGAAARQAVHLARSGRYDTICIHGDTSSAAETAARGAAGLARRRGGNATAGSAGEPQRRSHPRAAELDELRELEALLAGDLGAARRASDQHRTCSGRWPIRATTWPALASTAGWSAAWWDGWAAGGAASFTCIRTSSAWSRAARCAGVGFELKQHQRRWCLERGVKTIEWTTDPLVRRNAYFNLTKLGARASDYLVNFYGAMTDGLNAGEESDRLLISWELESRRAAVGSRGTRRRAGHRTPATRWSCRRAVGRAGGRTGGRRGVERARPYMSGA